jgi:hypothetical protein
MSEVPPTISGVLKSKKPFPWTWIILAAVLCVPVIFIGSFAAIPLITIYQADEGFRKAKKSIDPEQLRAWALESIKSYSGTNGYSEDISQSKIPDYIKNLYSTPPEQAWVNPKTSKSEGCVMIMWGGGFFHWGLNIGNTNFSEPFNSQNQEYPYNFEWVSGIYYTRESSWGLW